MKTIIVFTLLALGLTNVLAAPLNGKCWDSSKTMAQRDSMCDGDLVCARFGYDNRQYGGCTKDSKGNYVPSKTPVHHCCSKTPVHLVQAQIKAKHGICLDASQRSKNGGKVLMWTCDTNNQNQQWSYESATGQIKNDHGICLDASQRGTKGGKVHMWTCDTNNKNQQWVYDSSTGQIKARHGLCLDASQRTTRGGKVHMWSCDTKNLNQQWTIKEGKRVDKILKESVPHTLDMASLSAQVYYPNRHSKTVFRAGQTVTARTTGNKWKITRIIGDRDDVEQSYGKIWFAEFAEGQTCALVTRGSYWFSTLAITNMDWGTVTLPGTSYKVMKGYQDHITKILNFRDNEDKLFAWLKSCDGRGYQKIFTGHSLGGAVTTWLAMYFENKAETYRPDYIVTFGAPRLVQTFRNDKCPRSLQSRDRAVRIATIQSENLLSYVDAATLVPANSDKNEAFCFESMSLDKAGNLIPKNHQWPNYSFNFVLNAPGWLLHDEETRYEAWMKKAKAKAQAGKACAGEGKYCDKWGDWLGIGNCDKNCCFGSEHSLWPLGYKCKAESKPCMSKGTWCDRNGWIRRKCSECCNGYGYVWWKWRDDCK